MVEISGSPAGRSRRFAILASRFNESVTKKLVDGAYDALVKHEVPFDNIDLVWVPGAWELPTAARWLMDSDRYNALVVVGAIVRGETSHFNFLASTTTTELAKTSAEYDVPVGLGLLTCETMAQAEARAGGSHGNKGWDAALAALEMADLAQSLENATLDED